MRSFLIMYLCVSCVCACAKTFASDLFEKAIEKQEDAEAEQKDDIVSYNASADGTQSNSEYKSATEPKKDNSKTNLDKKVSKKKSQKTEPAHRTGVSNQKKNLTLENTHNNTELNNSDVKPIDREVDVEKKEESNGKQKTSDLFEKAIEKQEEIGAKSAEKDGSLFDKIAQEMVNSISSSKRKNKQLNSLNKRLAAFRNDTDENAIFSLFLGLYDLVGASIFNSCFQKLVDDSNFKQEVSNLLANLKTKILSGDLYQGKNEKKAKTLYDVMTKHL